MPGSASAAASDALCRCSFPSLWSAAARTEIHARELRCKISRDVDEEMGAGSQSDVQVERATSACHVTMRDGFHVLTIQATTAP